MQWLFFLSSALLLPLDAGALLSFAARHGVLGIFFFSVFIGISWCRGTLIAAGGASLRILLVDLLHRAPSLGLGRR
jgi:hypothetical protein